MHEPEILFDVDDRVGILTLNRPRSLNSLTLDSTRALLGMLRDIGSDHSLRALVVTGAGRGFCAGWQLDGEELPGLPGESLGVRQAHLMAEYFNPVIQALHDLPVPVVAAVNGVSAGGGVGIALGADVAVAAESASFVLTYAPRLGLLPDLGLTWKLPRLIGWARTQAVTLLGERVTATEAAQWGMIWRAVPDADLRATAMALAVRMAASPPGIARELRYAHEAAQQRDLAAQMDYERARQRVLLDAPAFREGVAAFREKRMPDFHGDEP